jgi:hypothetical protein
MHIVSAQKRLNSWCPSLVSISVSSYQDSNCKEKTAGLQSWSLWSLMKFFEVSWSLWKSLEVSWSLLKSWSPLFPLWLIAMHEEVTDNRYFMENVLESFYNFQIVYWLILILEWSSTNRFWIYRWSNMSRSRYYSK